MKIMLNPGHAPNGVPDPGACGDFLRECDVVLLVGNKVAGYLRNVGYEVEILQSDSLSEVCKTANSCRADLFISIHCNAAANPSAKGTETWYCAGSIKGEKLATCIQGQIVNSLPVVDRDIKCATPHVNGLYVLSNTDMPACLVEMAFISNSDDEQLLANKQDDFARAIARGISDYVR